MSKIEDEFFAHTRQGNNVKGIHRFVVGESYENRKGRFKVVSMTTERMRIAFDNGELVETTMDDQERIISNMEREVQVEANQVLKKAKKSR